MWRHYLATDDRTFLEHNYPVMADAARFLLAYAVEGADGKLHTSPSNAHETQWDVADPITDSPGDEDAVPDRGRGRHAARPGRARSSPSCRRRSRRSSTSRPRRATARTCSPTRRTRLAQLRNVENLDLETVFPFNTVTDQTPAEFEMAKASYATRRFVNANDWSLDAGRRRAPAQRPGGRRAPAGHDELAYQIFANGLANLGPSGATNVYDEHVRRHRAGDQRGAGDGLRRPPAHRARRCRRAGTPRARSSCSTARRCTCRCRTA